MIAPLFTILGYDVADPRECQPEYKSFGKDRGKQPVDWAFFVNGSLAFLVEAKAVGKRIDRYDEQLGDYYGKGQPDVKLGILTTGVQWRFFTDLVNLNKMDNEPFLEWDVLKGPIPYDFLTVLQRAEFKPELIKDLARGKRRQSALVAELTRLLERAKTKTELHAGVSPNDGGWIATGAGKGGLGYVYVINKHESSVQLFIDRGKDSEEETRAVFDTLKANQREIERLFGEPLSWEPLEGKRAKRIAKYFELGGYRDDQAKWPEIQDAMIDAMVRLESALKPSIAGLKAGA